MFRELSNLRHLTRSRKKYLVLAVAVALLTALATGLLLEYPSFSEVKGLKGAIYKESVESHPIDPESFQGKIIAAVERVTPAVVGISGRIRVEYPASGRRSQFFGDPFEDFEDFFRRFFEQFPRREQRERQPVGSGMIINKDGYILTNTHVIQQLDKDDLWVTLPEGRDLKAELLEADEKSDIAVLKVEDKGLPAVTFGHSEDLKVGQWVIALGYPFGATLSQLKKEYEPTATVGVISATDRSIQAGRGRVTTYTGLLQTDASVNPGNSGGPLINIYGEIVGINTAILSTSGGSIGIGFAIPIDKAKRLLDSLVEYGEIRRPWIGISLRELTPELAEKLGVKKGVLVAGVVKESPADKAGIQAGDIIQKLNGRPVDSGLDVVEEIQKTKIGEEITLTLIREGEEMDITFSTGKEPQEEIVQITEGELSERLLGIQVHSINPELEKKYDLKEGEKGVVVTGVDSGSPAAQAGINVGDVIKSVVTEPVGEMRVNSLREFEEAMKKVKPGDIVRLRVRHGIWEMTVWVSTRK